MKKLMTIFFSTLLALSLSACGNGSQDSGTGTQAGSPSRTGESQEGNMEQEDGSAAADGGSMEQEGGSAATDGGNMESEGGSGRTEGGEQPEDTNGGDSEGNANTAAGADDAAGEGGNILVAYFSVMETDGVDTVAGASRVAVDGEVLGNNQYIAQIIQRETGGALFSIETVQEYPRTHDPLLEFAYEEKSDNARPELATQIENFDDYDVVFLGFPNWNADLPMPLYTFLEEYDFGGKTIVPFTTHGGSGFSRTIQTIAGLQPDATVITDGLSVSRNSVPEAESEVIDWVNGLGLNY